MKKHIRITTLGCKVNQFESASFATGCATHDCLINIPDADADVLIINTCAVTGKAGAQSRQAIRHAARTNPHARLLITGCYAEIAAKEIHGFAELHNREYCIVGNSEKEQIVPFALSKSPVAAKEHLGDISQATTICSLPVQGFPDRTRAYLRVQDGCESYCSYCIVPFTRGPSRSLPYQMIAEQMRVFCSNNFKEIVLTGIHLGYYGRDLQKQSNILQLLDALSTDFPKLRFRISSLEPTEITEDLLHLIAERDNLMPHLHIPLQSGDDTILSLMNRRYSTSDFKHTIELCRKYVPDAAIGIDLLTGFPGETEQLARNTEQFLNSLEFTYLHVFPFSSRKGTQAAQMKGSVPQRIKEQRAGRLRELSKQHQESFYLRHLHSVRQVLVEGKRDKHGNLHGYTDNYIPVNFPGSNDLINTIIPVQLNTISNSQIQGKVVDHEN